MRTSRNLGLALLSVLPLISLGCSAVKPGSDKVFQDLHTWKVKADALPASKDYTAAQVAVNSWIAYKETQLDAAKSDLTAQVDLNDIPQDVKDKVNATQTPMGGSEDYVKAALDWLSTQAKNSRADAIAAYKASFETVKWTPKP
jgi:maltodextrin utilization protein YvdJ